MNVSKHCSEAYNSVLQKPTAVKHIIIFDVVSLEGVAGLLDVTVHECLVYLVDAFEIVEKDWLPHLYIKG